MQPTFAPLLVTTVNSGIADTLRTEYIYNTVNPFTLANDVISSHSFRQIVTGTGSTADCKS